MKKFLSAMLICAMIVSFASCSKDDSNNKASDDDYNKITTAPDTDANTDIGSDEANTETGAVTDAVTDVATDTVTDAVTDAVTDVLTEDAETKAPETDEQTKAPETDEQTKAPETDEQTKAPETDEQTKATDTEASGPKEDEASVLADYKRGVYKNNKYESKFLGIGFNIDKSLTVATEEELKQIVELTSGVTGDDYEQLVKDGKAAYDFYAANADGTTNIIITLEKIDPSILESLDLESVYTQSAALLDQTYAGMGFTEFDRNIKTVKISGADHVVMDYVASVSGASMYQSIFLIKGGDYLATVCLTTLDKAIADSFYNKIYLVQ